MANMMLHKSAALAMQTTAGFTAGTHLVLLTITIPKG